MKLPSSSQRSRSWACRSSAIWAGLATWSRLAAICKGLVAHLRPVFDGGADVAEDPLQALLDSSSRLSSETRSISTAIQDSMCEALSPCGNQVGQAGHRRGVATGDADVGRHPGHLDQLAGFPVAGHHEQRVEDEVDGGVLADQFGVDGVHEERHVVRDDIDDAAVFFVDDGDVRVPGSRVAATSRWVSARAASNSWG